jgi:hypothetical protein
VKLLDFAQFNSIRGRLWIGFGVLVGILLLAGFEARSALTGMSNEIVASLSEVEADASLTSQVSADVAKTIEAASRYLDTRDTSAQSAFRAFGWAAHEVQRQMNSRPNQSATEVAALATIDGKLSEMEIHYALAHRLADLGRADRARVAAVDARRSIDSCWRTSLPVASRPRRSPRRAPSRGGKRAALELLLSIIGSPSSSASSS